MKRSGGGGGWNGACGGEGREVGGCGVWCFLDCGVFRFGVMGAGSCEDGVSRAECGC